MGSPKKWSPKIRSSQHRRFAQGVGGHKKIKRRLVLGRLFRHDGLAQAQDRRCLSTGTKNKEEKSLLYSTSTSTCRALYLSILRRTAVEATYIHMYQLSYKTVDPVIQNSEKLPHDIAPTRGAIMATVWRYNGGCFLPDRWPFPQRCMLLHVWCIADVLSIASYFRYLPAGVASNVGYRVVQGTIIHGTAVQQ